MDIQLKKTLTMRQSNPKKKQQKYRKLANRADILFAVITIQRVARRWLDKKKRREERKRREEELTKSHKRKSIAEFMGL